MDSVSDSPSKRRKMANGHTPSGSGYNSQEDSCDELLRTPGRYETVATVPVTKPAFAQQSITQQLYSPPQRITQPTQIIDRSTPEPCLTGRAPSIVQVAASSPLRAQTDATPTTAKKSGGILASSMAPAGTSFRLPFGVRPAPAKPPAIDLTDDEGPTYRGGSSDEDSQVNRRANIKPSTFVSTGKGSLTGSKGSLRVEESPNTGMNKFREITANSFYKPIDKTASHGSTLTGSVYDSRNREDTATKSRIAAPAKRSADVLANAYGGSSRPPKQVRQAGPARAQPVQDISLDEIDDYQLRTKVKRMMDILPSTTVLLCKNALVTKRGNFDDAMDLLTSEEEHRLEIDLTLSDNDGTGKAIAAPRKPQAKQQVKAPNRTIQDKWASTQALPKPSQASPSHPTPPPKPKRKLVQGRKKPSLPSSPPAAEAPKLPPPRPRTPESDDSDSGIEVESEDDPELERKVLAFFNSCAVQDLADIAATSEEIAGVIVSQRPFKTLDEVRQISSEAPRSTAGKRKTTKKAIGDKLVDKCLEMWTGYEAVDELVTRCEALGKPVAEDMKRWGVDVYGAAKNGELDLVNFDDIKVEGKTNPQPSVRDSGIATPASTTQSAEEDDGGDDPSSPGPRKSKNKSLFFSQPAVMAEGVVLKDYQVVGVNWLALLYRHNLSCILADDMGLGKTCQVIAFIAHLFEKGIKGPHLVVVPGSTLENWLREFSVFCPTLSVMPYYAEQKERATIREQIEDNIDNINVVVTTYGMAKAKLDNRFLRHLNFGVCVYDEGHILKNRKSAGYDQFMRIPAKFRLLLTGTPLQNNLRELASLLGFILPSVFREHEEALEFVFSHKAKTTEENHAALLSAQRIARARSMMAPFVLRRKKHQVLKHLPTKTRRVEYCELSPSQHDIYAGEQARARAVIQSRLEGKKSGTETSNIMMALRQAAIHPLLFRRLYTDDKLRKMSRACLKEPEFAQSDIDLVYEDMSIMTDFELHTFCEKYPHTMSSFALRHAEWMDSGKVTALAGLLDAYKQNKDRVLIFSQFTMVMNVLECVLETLDTRFFRLDGSTAIDERQDMIDAFHDDPSIPVFLLSTKAGGAGINLACANKVVVFDGSFNPQEDVQAENRAHRVGQTREVEVVRLVCRGTIEEQILRLGETKLMLDERVAGAEGTSDGSGGGGVDGSVAGEEEGKVVERRGVKMVEEMMVAELKREVGVTEKPVS